MAWHNFKRNFFDFQDGAIEFVGCVKRTLRKVFDFQDGAIEFVGCVKRTLRKVFDFQDGAIEFAAQGRIAGLL